MLRGRLVRKAELSVLGVAQPSLSDHRTTRMPSTQHVSSSSLASLGNLISKATLTAEKTVG